MGNDRLRRIALPPEQLLHQLPGGLRVTPALDEKIQDLTFGVNGAPRVHSAPADRDKHLIKMPAVIWSWPESSELAGIGWTEL